MKKLFVGSSTIDKKAFKAMNMQENAVEQDDPKMSVLDFISTSFGQLT